MAPLVAHLPSAVIVVLVTMLLGSAAPLAQEPARMPASPAVTEARSGRAGVNTRVMFTSAGWLGFALGCSRCGWVRDANGAAVWATASRPVILGVQRGSPAERAGLRSGDVLVSINGVPVTEAAAGRLLGAPVPGQRLQLSVVRAAGRWDTTLEVAPRPRAGAARVVGHFAGVDILSDAETAPLLALDTLQGDMTITIGGATVRLRAARAEP